MTSNVSSYFQDSTYISLSLKCHSFGLLYFSEHFTSYVFYVIERQYMCHLEVIMFALFVAALSTKCKVLKNPIDSKTWDFKHQFLGSVDTFFKMRNCKPV